MAKSDDLIYGSWLSCLWNGEGTQAKEKTHLNGLRNQFTGIKSWNSYVRKPNLRKDYQLTNQRYNHEYNLKFRSKVSTNILFNNMNKLEAV